MLRLVVTTRIGYVALLAATSLALSCGGGAQEKSQRDPQGWQPLPSGAAPPLANPDLASCSPDGDLAYMDFEETKTWVVIKDRSGTSRKVLVETKYYGDSSLALDYSPDGRMLAMKYSFGLYLIDVATGKVRKAGPVAEFFWSPDSQHVAVRPFEDGTDLNRIIRSSDGTVVRTLPQDGWPEWAPNRRGHSLSETESEDAEC